MEILDRKVMARFGQKLSLVRVGEAFDLAQLICQVLKSQKKEKSRK
jgi:NADH:ubiquinone oxidoreductase subunit H